MKRNMIGAMLCIIFISLSCQSESEKKSIKLNNDLKSFFTENYIDSSMSVDSFRLIRIDTISKHQLLYEQTNKLLDDYELLTSYLEINRQKISLSVSQMKMYKLIGSNELFEIEKKDYDEILKKTNIIVKESDTLKTMIDALIDSTKNADTVKPINYLAACFFQIRNKDKSVKRDTAYIYLNKNQDIIKRADFLNMPYKVDFEKFQ